MKNKVFTLLLNVLTAISGFAVEISSTTTSQINICGAAGIHEVKVHNTSYQSIFASKIVIDLPQGVSYLPQSVSTTHGVELTELDVDQTSTLEFAAGNVPAGDSLIFAINYTAGMAAVDYQNSGAIFRHDVQVVTSDTLVEHTSPSYNISYPVLSILNVSPKSQTIVSGASTTRTITIINGGNGRTDKVSISDIRNSAFLNLDKVSIGRIINDTIVIAGADFMSIGNGDQYLDQNESFTLTQTLSGTTCSDITVTSTIKAHWGCEQELISTSSSYSHVTLDFQNPSLKINTTADLNACFGQGESTTQFIEVINTGKGIAGDIVLDIYKSHSGNSMDEAIYSRIDLNSMLYKISAEGVQENATVLSSSTTRNDGAYSCLGTNPIGQVAIALPDLAPGDTIFVQFDTYSCCPALCNNQAIQGWKCKVDYTDVCEMANYSKSTDGQGRNNQNMGFTTETPTDIINGQQEVYTFIVSSFTNTLPQGTGAYYQADFELGEGLVYERAAFHSNNSVWAVDFEDYDRENNSVTLRWLAPAPFTIPKSEVSLTLSGTCGVPGWKTINMNLSYVPDGSCATCTIPLGCDIEVETYLHCPDLGCDKLNVLGFTAKRMNYGSPDNDLNGLPDASGSIDFNLIKTNRAMIGDTVMATATAVVGNEQASWPHAYFESYIDFGAAMDLLGAEVIVFDASANRTTLSTVPFSYSTTTYSSSVSVDLSTNVLVAGNNTLAGYTFEQGDSVQLNLQFRVARNVHNLIKETTFLNNFYLSQSATPSSAQQDKCNFKNGRITLIGHQWRNESRNNFTVKSCTQSVHQDFGLSIGDLSSNYAGGNLFPFEYRNWGWITAARVTIPAGYTHVNTTIRQYRTVKTNQTSTQAVYNIEPDLIEGNTLVYDLERFYTTGQWHKSDDGWNGRIWVELAPDCEVPQNIFEEVNWTFDYQESQAINSQFIERYAASQPDRIRYQPSTLLLSSTDPIQDANTRNISWDYQIKNNSNSKADNVWVNLNLPDNMELVSIVNDANNQPLSLQNDIYLVGSINAGQTANMSINGRISNCDTVVYTATSGYECTGYPVDFASFTCDKQELQLKVEPKPAAYQPIISAELMEDPCSAFIDLIVDVTSVKIAHMYDMQVKVLADTAKIKVLSGFSQFKYNSSQDYSAIGNPTYANGAYIFDIDTYDASFASNGIPGVTNLANNRYWLKTRLELLAGYTPGDFIQVQTEGANACNVSLPQINLAYDPNSKFQVDQTAGLHLDAGNSWTASWGDYDGDGYDDLFVPMNDKSTANILYRNNGDGTFTKQPSTTLPEHGERSISGVWGDYDNDGDPDLFVCNNTDAGNALYRNNGDGTFSDVTDNSVVNNGVYSHSAAWADYNGDGNLDLVVTDFHPTNFNFLYQGDGQGGFKVDKTSEVSQSATSALGASWADMDGDGDLDLFIANTNGENNQLFRNNKGVLQAVTAGPVVTDGGTSIGGAWGDYDNDGDLDLYVTNSRAFEPNFFYENIGDGQFQKVIESTIVQHVGNSHGASWIDFDNDGDLDLLVANDNGQQNFLFINNGNESFTKINNAITQQGGDSYGTAWSDYDNDGDYDLYIANRGSETNDFFLNQKGACTNYVGFRLKGCMSNSFGIGATIRVLSEIQGKSVWQTKHISTQTSALGGQNSAKVIFGLGSGTAIDSVIIQWPSGIINQLSGLNINQLHTINETCGELVCGTVFHDNNGNNVQDDQEPGIPNQSLTISPQNIKVYTDNHGQYQFYATNGQYQIKLDAVEAWDQNSPSNYAPIVVDVDMASSETYCGNDFGASAICQTSDLSISLGATAFRRGLTNDLNLVVTNGGAYNTEGNLTIELKTPEFVYMVDSAWTSVQNIDNSLVYTYQLDSLQALSDSSWALTDSIGLESDIDQEVLIQANIFDEGEDCALQDNSITLQDMVVGSLDPNDMQVFILDQTAQHVALPTDRLLYKIRFQNVGNYAARIVTITTAIPSDLDLETLRLESTSHPFSVNIENGMITWQNRHIELSDSISDPEGSQGYVSFSISPRNGLERYTVVQSQANIQFDYNDWITTNVVDMVIDNDRRSVQEDRVITFPNPITSHFKAFVVGKDQRKLDLTEIRILDLNGQTVLVSNVQDKFTQQNLSEWNAGAYLLELTDVRGMVHRQKIMIN